MNIREFSKRTGISAHTLRYYEKIGVFRDISRNSSGHRDYTEQDISWAEFINRLKETGMPLEQIKSYADLRKQGGHTADARMDLLIHHASTLEQKISQDRQHLDKIHEKIAIYEKMIQGENPS